MKYFFVILTVLLTTGTSYALPQSVLENLGGGNIKTTVTFLQNDSSDSLMLPVRSSCYISFVQKGTDAVALYEVTNVTQSTAALTAFATLIATTTTPILLHPTKVGVKVKATVSTTGGSLLIMRCGPDSKSAVDPSYSVRFELATVTDDPMVYTTFPIVVQELHCIGDSVAVGQIISVEACGPNGTTCVATGLTVTMGAANVSQSDNLSTSPNIPGGTYWGIHTQAVATAANNVDCTVYADLL